MARGLMWAGVVVVAGAAAVLSFTALRDLALMCGFGRRLAWLLPVAIDVGTALGSLVWLGRWTPDPARRYARGLALALLGGSVAGNALGHGLAAYGARPHWLVVVAVSAVAPVVLAAVVHLVVLATHPVAAVVRVTGLASDRGPVPTGPPDQEPGRVDHGPVEPGPAPDLPDQPRTTVSPTDLDLAAELAALAGAETARSGEVDQPGPEPDRPQATVPNQAADDPTLAADLRSWAGDQTGRPSRNAVMRRYGIGATRANHLLADLPRTGTGPGPDHGDRGPGHRGSAPTTAMEK